MATGKKSRRTPASTTPATAASNGSATTALRSTVRHRLGGYLEASAVESALDRVLSRRLRPLREEVKAARVAFEEQTLLRAEAEVRAARAEDEAAGLRVRLAQVEGDLAAQRRSTGWWRRRRVAEQRIA